MVWREGGVALGSRGDMPPWATDDDVVQQVCGALGRRWTGGMDEGGEGRGLAGHAGVVMKLGALGRRS